MPKSVTFTVPSAASKMLPGLLSRWMTRLRWATSRAEATSAAISAARRGSNAPSERSTSRSDRPLISSITMKYVLASSPQS